MATFLQSLPFIYGYSVDLVIGCRHFSQAYTSLEYSWNTVNVELCGVVSSTAALDGWNCK